MGSLLEPPMRKASALLKAAKSKVPLSLAQNITTGTHLLGNPEILEKEAPGYEESMNPP